MRYLSENVIVPDAPLLTIAIPTYNRASSLRENIPYLLDEINGTVKTPNSIEVIISDNASSDGTELLCTEFVKSQHYIRYYRNKTNLGPDRNFMNCVNLATGKYLILLGDDDKFTSGAIGTILDLIYKHPGTSLILLNSYKKIVSPKIVGTNQEYCFSPPKHLMFKDCDLFLREIDPDPLTFMSSLIFNVSDLRRIDDLSDGIGSHFIHTIWLLKVIKKNPNVYICPLPLILSGNEESLDFYQDLPEISTRRRNAEETLFAHTLNFYSNIFRQQCNKYGYKKSTPKRVFTKFLLRQSLMKAYTKLQGKEVYFKKRSLIFRYTNKRLISWVIFYPILILPTRIMSKFGFVADNFINILYREN